MTLIVCGVTTEVCVTTTVREANDRGYECVVLQDCVGSYFPRFQRAALDMIKACGDCVANGIFVVPRWVFRHGGRAQVFCGIAIGAIGAGERISTTHVTANIR